MGLIKIHNILK